MGMDGRRLGLALVALWALFALGCDAPSPTASRVAGVVRDGVDARPVAGAIVRAAGVEGFARTDRDGRFSVALGANPVLSVEAPEHLAATFFDVGEGPVALEVWPSHPSEAAVDAYLARRQAERVVRDDPNDPALRPEARAILRGEALPAPEGNIAPGDVGSVRAALDAPPESIRIWRRSIDGAAASCDGRIDVIPFEDYIAGVLPHEWISSWHDESLRAGAMTIRTYAWRWVLAGGKYDCADLDDTARSQVYRDDRVDRATAAVDDTRGQVITVGGALATGEYSAENGDPTALGVDEPLCTGRTVNGHGRGMCQWGSQRWALDGRDHTWIAPHYFPDSVIEGGGPALPAYDSVAGTIEAPATMISGDRAEVWIDFDNTGARSWGVGVRLGTSAPEDHESPFYDAENWIDPTRATPPDVPDYAPGAVGRFTFRVTAPEVTDETLITDTLRLVADDGTFFGAEATLSIRVQPRGGVIAPGVDAGASSGLDAGGTSGPGTPLSGGCGVAPGHGPRVAWMLVGVLALALRRRTNR